LLGDVKLLAPAPQMRTFRATDLARSHTVEVRLGPEDPSLRARFLRQVRVHGRLDHPRVQRMVEAGRHEGHPFMVLEPLAGARLSSELARGRRFTERALVTLGLQLLEAVEALHAVGTVHRELDAASVTVLAGADDDDATLKLVDLGSAMPIGRSTGEIVEPSVDVQAAALLLVRMTQEDWPNALSAPVRETLSAALGASMEPPVTAGEFHSMLRELDHAD
jgi:serine/threonine protein kinase